MAAGRRFRLTSPMPDVCSRLCPQERLCEGACVRGKRSRAVAIGRLEAFVAGQEPRAGARPAPSGAAGSGKRVAVVGSGPAGLAAAERLSLAGHAVAVFEAWPEPGGVLTYGIPTFKMDKEMTARGTVAADSSGATSRRGVFAAGDNVRGADLVVTAVAGGLAAASAIDEFLTGLPGEGVPDVPD